MTITQLRYFLQICDCNGITCAASQLFISQQALSKTVRTLEQELGAPLFLRTKSGIVLTKAGTLLRDQSRPIVEQFDHFSSSIRRSIRMSSGTLRLCIFEDCLSLVTMDDFNHFRELFPQYSLEIKEYQFQVCNQRLLEGKHDAALTIEPILDKNIVNIPLQSRELVTVIHRDSPLMHRETVRFQDLHHQRLIMSIDERGYRAFCQLCDQHHVEPSVIQRVSQLSNMFGVCSHNGYLGLTADYSAEKLVLRYPNLMVKRLEGKPSPYPVTLAYHISNEKLDVLSDFIKFLKATIA